MFNKRLFEFAILFFEEFGLPIFFLQHLFRIKEIENCAKFTPAGFLSKKLTDFTNFNRVRLWTYPHLLTNSYLESVDNHSTYRGVKLSYHPPV